jgi:hypothetical protein
MTTTKIQHCFFFEPREELYTGEETPLDLLLNGISLSSDIHNHINGFLEEEPEHPYMCGEESYIYFHDTLYNKYSFPVEQDEKHCFDTVFDDDFAIDEDTDGTPLYDDL